MRRNDRQRRPSRWTRLLALLATLALLVAACGNGDDDDDGDGTDAGSTTTATTDDDDPTTSGSTDTTGPSTTESTTTTTTAGPQTVVVFFGTGDPDECAAVAPHERTVGTDEDPIQAAFDALVAGPTAAEEGAGASSFFSADTEGSVRSATVDNGVLTVDLDDVRPVLTPAGANTSCGSAALLAELHATAFQFAAVDEVRYELEGSCDDFGEWLQRGCIEIDRATWADEVASLLPGEHADGILTAGTIFGVIGVEVDDQLNVRALPGADQAIIGSLEPLATGLVYTGRARKLEPPVAIWYEVEVGPEVDGMGDDGVVGWVHSRFVAPQSGTFDITSEVVEVVGEIPTGATVEEIGAIVIEARSRFADPTPSAVVVDGPTSGDLHEITYDLLGFGDDSVLGERLHLFIAEGDGAGDPLGLKSVEVTYLCARGTGGGTGLCP